MQGTARAAKGTIMLDFSRYTLHSHADEQHYLFNTLSGASLTLGDAQFETLTAVIEVAGDDRQSAAERGIVDFMLESGLLVAAGTDELPAALAQYDEGRHRTDVMSVVITPSLSCNMSCFYCYQDRASSRRLSSGDIGAIVRFVAERLQDDGFLEITWFGGEPLLEQEFIAAASRELMALAASRNAGYGARMISNCYHLDAAAVAMLEAYKVERVQVTFDGPREAHDKVRRNLDQATRTREGSFARIVDNVRNASDRLTITARVNVTEFNVDAMPELIDELADAGLNDKLAGLYFSPAYSFKTTAPTVSYAPREGVHVGKEAFAEAEVGLMRHAAARGFTLHNPLKAGYTGCVAVQANGFVIDADGEVKKCTNDVSRPATSFASIRSDSGSFDPEYTDRYEAFRPEDDAGCRSCSFLPVCYSACPQRNMLSEEDRREKCPSYKYNWQQTLPMLMAQQS